MLMKFSEKVGWVCRECRLESLHALHALKSEHAKLAEEVSLLIKANKLLTHRVAKLEQSVSAVPPTGSAWSSQVDNDENGLRNAFRDLVRREVVVETQEKRRRRRNVIVTGLEIPPTSTPAESLWMQRNYVSYLMLQQTEFT